MSGSGWSAGGGRGERIEGQGGPGEEVEDQRDFGDLVGYGESVVQIMVDEYRDAQIDSGEGL